MQRVIGSMLILMATTFAGFLYSAELTKYLEKLLYIRHLVSMLKGEITYSHAPLGEVFGSAAARVKEPYRTWLRSMERQVEQCTEDGFAKIWNRSIDKHLESLHLKIEHSIQLKELGIFLGQLDDDTLNGTLQLYLNRLELEIEKIREGMASKKRLGKCLGVMGGIFLVVVLL